MARCDTCGGNARLRTNGFKRCRCGRIDRPGQGLLAAWGEQKRLEREAEMRARGTWYDPPQEVDRPAAPKVKPTWRQNLVDGVAMIAAIAVWLLAYCILCPAEARERRHHQAVAPSAGHCWVSYYSHGNRVASGRRFDKHGMTAAHRSLPFGTRVRISRGDRHVTVTVNDRGPFIAGRMFDLSLGAARALGIIRAGVVRVAFEVLP